MKVRNYNRKVYTFEFYSHIFLFPFYIWCYGDTQGLRNESKISKSLWFENPPLPLAMSLNYHSVVLELVAPTFFLTACTLTLGKLSQFSFPANLSMNPSALSTNAIVSIFLLVHYYDNYYRKKYFNH